MKYYNYYDDEDWEDVGGYYTDEDHEEDNEVSCQHIFEKEIRRVQVTFDKDPTTRREYNVTCVKGLRVVGYEYNEKYDEVYPEYEQPRQHWRRRHYEDYLYEDQMTTEESSRDEELNYYKEKRNYTKEWEEFEAERLGLIKQETRQRQDDIRVKQPRDELNNKRNASEDDALGRQIRSLEREIAMCMKILRLRREENMKSSDNEE